MSKFKQFMYNVYTNGQGPYTAPIVIMKNTIVSWSPLNNTIKVNLISGHTYEINETATAFNDWMNEE